MLIKRERIKVKEGFHFVLFVAKPQGKNIVAYISFIGDRSEDKE